MSKRDALLKIGGLDSSIGVGRPVGPPPGLSPAEAVRAPARVQGVSRSANAVEIEIGRIRPDPDQPREEFDPEAIGRLAESLRSRGQLQPIRVRWDEGQGAYVILVGERRWRAARQAGLATLSCVIHQGEVDAGERLALQLVENALREDLKPIEQARAYRQLMDLHDWSGNRLSQELAIPQSAVVQALALLKLPGEVQEAVESGRLAPSTAYEVSKLDDAGEQTALAGRVVAEGLTRDQAVAEVRARRVGQAAAPRPAKAEFRREDGVVVTVTGAAGEAAVREALAWALGRAGDAAADGRAA